MIALLEYYQLFQVLPYTWLQNWYESNHTTIPLICGPLVSFCMCDIYPVHSNSIWVFLGQLCLIDLFIFYIAFGLAVLIL